MATCDSPENIALSDRICTGLQLANHWQDIARDYAAGRVYLPEDAMREAGVTESMLGETSACEPLKRLVAEQSAIARRMLESGLPLAERVPKWLAADIRLFVRGGKRFSMRSPPPITTPWSDVPKFRLGDRCFSPLRLFLDGCEMPYN